MGLCFQRRIRLFPGMRLNFSKSGVPTSLGRRGARFTIGPRGTRETIGIPGTGLSYTEQQSANAKRSSPDDRGSGRGLVLLAILVVVILAAIFAH